MNITWKTMIVKAVRWIAPRIGKSPREFANDIAEEVKAEVERSGRARKDPPVMRFPPR